MNGNKEYGDYQTPSSFASKVCFYLKNIRKISPDIVIEPTCGIGNFIDSSLIFDAKKYYGIEINKKYCDYCSDKFKNKNVEIINNDFFDVNIDIKEKKNSDSVLFIGNPPWINNSFLSAIGSTNLPKKTNFKGLFGYDAITGESNFDICEYIILKIISQFRYSNSVIAMLCKTSVARNIFKEIVRQQIPCSCCDIVEFDALKVFGVNVSACLLFVQLSSCNQFVNECTVFSFNNPTIPIYSFGYKNNKFYSNLSSKVNDFDGQCCFEWRQGVKHDCSKIMELENQHNQLINGKKDIVEIEQDIVFPLIKSSMFKSPVINKFSKYVIVTQKRIKENTEHLKTSVPRTWAYLEKNKSFFENRKSSIYNNTPPFSMFGIGDYSYSKYKVGISGFYKEPLFSVIYSNDEKPVMVDDTCYFICFSEYDEAYVAMLYLNCDDVQNFLKSISFCDSKRPFTKKVLERLDFKKITSKITFEELKSTENTLKLDNYLTQEMLERFLYVPEMGQCALRLN